MPYLIIITALLVFGSFLIMSEHEDRFKRLSRSAQKEILDRRLTDPSFFASVRFPKLKKVIIEAINEIAKQDAIKGTYKNNFEQEKYSDMYKNEYMKVRKDLINKTAQLDFLQGNVSDKFEEDPVELKMYQEFYLKCKSEEETKKVISVWAEDNAIDNEEPISTEEFEEMFVKNSHKIKGNKHVK